MFCNGLSDRHCRCSAILFELRYRLLAYVTKVPARLLKKVSAFFQSRSSFFRDVVIILTGTVASRIVVLAAIPFLARMYTPAEFGVLALFMTINGIITVVACGRYEMAVVLPREDRDSAHLLVACIGLATCTAILTSIAFWLWADDLTNLLGGEALKRWIWLSPAVIWSVSIFHTLRSWASRKGEFASVSRANVAGSATTVTIQLFLGWSRALGAGGLIIGQVVGQVVHFVVLLLGVAKELFATIRNNLRFSRTVNLLKRYRRFPVFDSGASLLNAFSNELPMLMLGAFFTPAIAGYYAMSRRVLSMPMQVIGGSIAQVFFPKAKQQLDKGRLDELASSIVRKLAVVGVTPMLLVAVAAPELSAIVLGDAWIAASIYIQWISVWILSIFITAPLIQLFSVLERQNERLIYQIVLLVARITSLGFGGLQNDPVLAVALFCISSTVTHYANGIWILHRANVRPLSTVGILLGEFAKAIPLVAFVALIKWYFESDWLVLGAFVVAGLLFAGFRVQDLFSRSDGVLES